MSGELSIVLRTPHNPITEVLIVLDELGTMLLIVRGCFTQSRDVRKAMPTPLA